MHGICNAYTHNILVIYLAYTRYIQSKISVYRLNLFDIHGTCIVYVINITCIYLLYDNNNLPCPCNRDSVLAPGTQHPPAWTMGHESFQH